jgi:hypothetical protein
MHIPIRLQELKSAVYQGARNKSLGADGITHDFYGTPLAQWKHMTPSQPLGIIVCILKHQQSHTITDYMPITLLNDDYKIHIRLLARLLPPHIQDLLTTDYTAVCEKLTFLTPLQAFELWRPVLSLLTKKCVSYYLNSPLLLTVFPTNVYSTSFVNTVSTTT